MDPSRKMNIIKEQVHMEHAARRSYPRRWGYSTDVELHKFYNQTKVNQRLNLPDLCPYECTGQGDSYFLSPQMYRALLGTCRCGRKRSDAHLLKCLQKEKCRLDQIAEALTQTESDAVPALVTPPPSTSNAYFGWRKLKPQQQKWEQSTKYISPVCTMPGHRIADTPYNAIIIG